MSNFAQILTLPEFVADGSLSVVDNVLPFEIKRVFWIYDSDGFERGKHRHKKTKQALIALSGEIMIYMDNGVEQKDILLNKRNECLIVEPEDWHTMKFYNKGVLLVLASEAYNKDDYMAEKYK